MRLIFTSAMFDNNDSVVDNDKKYNKIIKSVVKSNYPLLNVLMQSAPQEIQPKPLPPIKNIDFGFYISCQPILALISNVYNDIFHNDITKTVWEETEINNNHIDDDAGNLTEIYLIWHAILLCIVNDNNAINYDCNQLVIVLFSVCLAMFVFCLLHSNRTFMSPVSITPEVLSFFPIVLYFITGNPDMRAMVLPLINEHIYDLNDRGANYRHKALLINTMIMSCQFKDEVDKGNLRNELSTKAYVVENKAQEYYWQFLTDMQQGTPDIQQGTLRQWTARGLLASIQNKPEPSSIQPLAPPINLVDTFGNVTNLNFNPVLHFIVPGFEIRRVTPVVRPNKYINMQLCVGYCQSATEWYVAVDDAYNCERENSSDSLLFTAGQLHWHQFVTDSKYFPRNVQLIDANDLTRLESFDIDYNYIRQISQIDVLNNFYRYVNCIEDEDELSKLNTFVQNVSHKTIIEKNETFQSDSNRCLYFNDMGRHQHRVLPPPHLQQLLLGAEDKSKVNTLMLCVTDQHYNSHENNHVIIKLNPTRLSDTYYHYTNNVCRQRDIANHPYYLIQEFVKWQPQQQQQSQETVYDFNDLSSPAPAVEAVADFDDVLHEESPAPAVEAVADFDDVRHEEETSSPPAAVDLDDDPEFVDVFSKKYD